MLIFRIVDPLSANVEYIPHVVDVALRTGKIIKMISLFSKIEIICYNMVYYTLCLG